MSPARRRLVGLFQQLNFGRLEHLIVHNGEPVLDPLPQVVSEIKFGGENGPRSEPAAGDFTLKPHLIELFAHFDRIGNGVIETLEVKHGLPFRMLVRESAA